MIYWQLFLSFIQIGAFSIGGGYAAIPLIQDQVVSRYGWLTMEEFANLVTIAEMTPGPITVNSATFVGIRIAGIGGALVATMGCILPSCVFVSFLAYLYYRYRKMALLQSVLGSLRPAVVALITVTGLTMLQQVVLPYGKIPSLDWLAGIIFALAFFMLRQLKKNPILVMGICGIVYLGGQCLLI